MAGDIKEINNKKVFYLQNIFTSKHQQQKKYERKSMKKCRIQLCIKSASSAKFIIKESS